MLSPSLSLAYLKLILLGGTVTVGGTTSSVPTGSRYISFHQNAPTTNSAELVSRQLLLFTIDESLNIAVNTNTITFPSFNADLSSLYCSLWSTITSGSLIAYTKVSISPLAFSSNSLVIQPQMFVIEPSMCSN
jgi:hypothetical protein